MCKVKMALFALALSAVIWSVSHSSDSTPQFPQGGARNHTRAVVATNIATLAPAAPALAKD